MKNITLLSLMLSFIDCNLDKKTSELQSIKLNTSLIGVYEYKTPEKSENHYIFIDTLNGSYKGFYFGTEDSGGHGVFFYGNEIENLNFKKEKINFEIGKRELYETTRMRIVKHKRDLKRDSTIGISKGQLKYSGEIIKNGFKINCDSKFGYCWDTVMVFEKMSEYK